MIKKSVVLSNNAVEEISYIRNFGIDCFCDYCNLSVNKNISDHADISFFFDGNDTLFVSNENEICAEQLSQFCKNIIILKQKLSVDYPSDVKLNCVRVGDHFICNTRTVSEVILEHMKKNFNIIDVKQGYTKCSVLTVSNNAFITDDISIYNQCISFGIDVLYVGKGDVSLPGYNYGFIGGCGGKIDDSTMVFCGNIKNHRDYKKILDFLSKYNVKYHCTDKKLTDIGSILPLYKV